RARKGRELLPARQLALDQQVRDLEEGAALGQLRDVVAAVAEDALLTVDERDRALAGARVGIARSEPDQPGPVAELADVERTFALGALDDVERDDPTVDAQFRLLGHRTSSPNGRARS